MHHLNNVLRILVPTDRGRLLFLIGAMIVASLVIAFPELLFRHTLGTEYQGIPLDHTSDETYYLARIREVMEGKWNIGHPYFHEDKTRPFTQPPLAEILLGILFRVFPLSEDNFLLACRLFFPATTLLLAFYFFRIWTEEEFILPLSMATLLVLGHELLFLKPPSIFSPSVSFAWFARPVHPQATYLGLIGTVLLLYRLFIQDSLSLPHALATGLALGAQFYCNLYYWTFLLPFALHLAIVWGGYHRKPPWAFVSALATGVLIGVPYGYLVLQARGQETFAEVSAYLGLVESSRLVIPKIAGGIFTFSLVLLLTRHFHSPKRLWFLIAASGVLVFLA